jgi:hypothetical protein
MLLFGADVDVLNQALAPAIALLDESVEQAVARRLLQPVTLLGRETSLVSLQFLKACVVAERAMMKSSDVKGGKGGRQDGLTADQLIDLAVKGADM